MQFLSVAAYCSLLYLETYLHRDSLGFYIIVLRLTFTLAAVGKLEKHLLRSCHTELQSGFTGRPIMQVLTSPPTLPSASVQISLLLWKQAASSLSTYSKTLLYWFHHILVYLQIYDQNSFAELTQARILGH